MLNCISLIKNITSSGQRSRQNQLLTIAKKVNNTTEYQKKVLLGTIKAEKKTLASTPNRNITSLLCDLDTIQYWVETETGF